MKWTEEETRWAMEYGVCEECGAPRKSSVKVSETGAESRIICIADEAHDAFATWRLTEGVARRLKDEA